MNPLSQKFSFESHKRKIEENFQIWLARLPVENNSDEGTPTGDTDLYSFYRELCALRHEFRKSIHRNHDSTTHFAEKLEDFAAIMAQINQRLEQQKNDRNQVELQNQRQMFLPLVDIYERFLRLQEHLQSPLKKSFWQRRQQFTELQNERDKLKKGFSILEQHFLALLEKEGIQRQICRGHKFDPSTMTAVEVVNIPEIAANEVVEEISTGYSYHNQTLKLAEVIVNRVHQNCEQ
ncbi:MAG: nucleotide exchange factor GrpE [Deltaproteobacteria bacterium]|nr:nucleotide exchange factor GrpE [Candidatus Tharpella sp.]